MAFIRPSMHARDSSGRQVSLLNDDPTPRKDIPYSSHHSKFDDGTECSRSDSYMSESSPPATPDLLRSDSYDSRNSNDPNSPLTPSMMEFRRQSSYTTPYPDPSQYDKRLDRASIYGSYHSTQHTSGSESQPSYSEHTSNPYDEDNTSGSAAERSGPASGKRYPCRFKDTHGCDKSFTTSGHASRHSKIHTAEKAVHCQFPGCQKKFTRADNMKQHLETHYKERSRSSSHKSSSGSGTKLTLPAGVKKSSGRISRPTSRTGWPEQQLSLDTMGAFASYSNDRYNGASTYYSPQSPATSPKSVQYGALDLGSFSSALPSQSMRVPRSMASSGLDALAAAVAYESQLGN